MFGGPTRRSKSTERPKGAVEVVTMGDAALVNVIGFLDERFAGFGDLGTSTCAVLNVSGMTRMSSFGVRQWLNALESLPKSITSLYLLGCPTFFVDQLNMVLNFGGASKVLTLRAPYLCTSCGRESGETIDVLAERANLAKGCAPDKTCSQCSSKLEFEETPESYFAFVSKYAATSIEPAAAELLAAQNLYTSLDGAAEPPPKIIKLIHGSVTYFRITGTIGAKFRARPFLLGAEGEMVIDLAEVERFDPAGDKEWRRMLKSLAGQVSAITLVDVNESFLANAGESFMIARNLAVASVLVPYACDECGRRSQESESLLTINWPRDFENQVCTKCGGITRCQLSNETLIPLKKASTSAPEASAKMIAQRDEILSRALTDANVAQAGEGASAAIVADDVILGKYKIVRRLSSGGMAEVFLAKQVGIGGFEKPVALKRIQHKLLESRHLAIDMFLNEAKIAGRLTHPNIVQVLDVGEVGGALYLAMEYVRGKDLREVFKKLQQSRRVMPIAEACYVVGEVAQALHHAYWSTDMGGTRLSVVHRDVSLQNIILSYDGMVKLLDFGVAMSAVTEHKETVIVGKWLYMSPEATMNSTVDHRSDLFSLGVVLYLLCSGSMPFTGKVPREIIKQIRAGQYKPLQELVAVPERLATLVDRLLAPNPADRPQKGQEVAAELMEIGREAGLESSGPTIATLLTELFPREASGASHGDGPRVEIVRASASFANQTPDSASPASVTPSTGSVSMSLQPGRRSASISIGPPMPPASIAVAISGRSKVRTLTPKNTAGKGVPRSIALPAVPVAKPRRRTRVVALTTVALVILIGLAVALYLFVWS